MFSLFVFFTDNINGHTSYHDGKYYETCSNCLLSEDTTLLPDGKSKGRYFFLFSKSFFKPSSLILAATHRLIYSTYCFK